jgi:pyruvate/2-oxoglutarate/acetoin dehydrogenase E1 component
MRKISYGQALNEAMIQEMERDPSVFVYGIGVPDHKRILGTTNNLVEKFGKARCFDTPLSEDAMTGLALGAALNGLRPVQVHVRVDFLMLCMNQIVNMISSYRYSVNGKLKVPMVIRAIIGRGWGQTFHHSKSMQSLFAHIPGIKVVMPTTPRDAKGLLIAAIRDDNPVIFIEHRWLYYTVDEVPEEPFMEPIGEPNIIKKGQDFTIVATSWMNVEALKASEILRQYHGIDVEIIDPRTLSPLNDGPIIKSVNRTGRCIIADYDWVHCGFGAELAARISHGSFGKLKSPVSRIGFSFGPCPSARPLENIFFPNAATIVRETEAMLKLKPADLSHQELYTYEHKFKGPF